MQLVIQAVANRGKDMSAERVDQTLIILMIAQSRTRDTQAEIGMAIGVMCLFQIVDHVRQVWLVVLITYLH